MEDINKDKKESHLDNGDKTAKENGNEIRNAIYEYELKLAKSENNNFE